MRAFWKKLTVFLLPLAALLVGVNIIADPGGLYRHDYERALAVRLLAGEPAGIQRNFDDRLLVRLLAAGRNAPPRLVVLGSSASLELTADDFCLPPDEYWNLSVSGATLQDYIALIGVLEANGQLPQRLVLELTPRLLAGDPQATRWQTLRADYEAMRLQLSLDPLPARWASSQTIEALQELISPSYFQESVGYILSGGLDRDHWFTLSERRAVRLPQGAQLYPLSLTPDAAGVETLARNYLSENPAWPAMDLEVLRAFAALARQLDEWGIELAIYLPPFHPEVYAAQRGNAAEAYADYLAAVDHLASGGLFVPDNAPALDAILGGHDPAAFGLTADGFRDGVHLLKPALNPFFAPLGCGWSASDD